ncbi:hypothetical protein KC726_03665 [Candidatus Woesebacteria bacterium]|nr:hypothetical protein [Candidatus Woesebacteria bacterium]
MNKIDVKDTIHKSVRLIETILAAIVIISVCLYIFSNMGFFITADWQSRETFYDFIYRVLLTTIGLELARMLVTHNFMSILELLAFVVARKMLKPDITTVDIVLGIISFVALLFANRYLINQDPNSKEAIRNNH